MLKPSHFQRCVTSTAQSAVCGSPSQECSSAPRPTPRRTTLTSAPVVVVDPHPDDADDDIGHQHRREPDDATEPGERRRRRRGRAPAAGRRRRRRACRRAAKIAVLPTAFQKTGSRVRISREVVRGRRSRGVARLDRVHAVVEGAQRRIDGEGEIEEERRRRGRRQHRPRGLPRRRPALAARRAVRSALDRRAGLASRCVPRAGNPTTCGSRRRRREVAAAPAIADSRLALVAALVHHLDRVVDVIRPPGNAVVHHLGEGVLALPCRMIDRHADEVFGALLALPSAR